ncbi:Alanyl-tRNA synthetase [Richelia intracellularis HH01]|uniref:Alanine--tRNA ligase n=1 Tax=Richelia intracellularis HH01 TaxID=1165094 RepID=M1WZB8_9NOST|nr:alanine--tRNA ligase [Richelia intracellularis]CCH66663.1 Alanyl-tRNA synthetase [Richelia intracellularis HH01]
MTDYPQKLSGDEIRRKFLEFYRKRGHQIVTSASLIPEDPTVLLTIAGMLTFKPIFLGQRIPEFPRAASSQKCIRTNDIENVGRTKRHHTFFEMLGNFSFGDYFKEQAISWGWEVSTELFGLPKERLIISVFDLDEETYAIWRDKIGVPEKRIKRMGINDNFWNSGVTGPCGPCSEIYYDFHPELGDDIDLEDDSRFIEFYNLVFMESNRDANGNLTPLASKNIDTGMGLERMAQILQQVPNNYETDLILPIIKKVGDIARADYSKSDEKTKISLKIISDHMRAIVHMIADHIYASNVGRGYVLRRLIRRVVRHGRLIGIDEEFTTKLAENVIILGESAYPHLRERESAIKTELQQEESCFLKTLARGEKILAGVINKLKHQDKTIISGDEIFKLYDTYGFPKELTQEIAEEEGLTIDSDGFTIEMQKQIKRAQSSHKTIDLTVKHPLDNKSSDHIHSTEFLGYTQTVTSVRVELLLVDGIAKEEAEAAMEVQVVLNKTPFYAESGGQIGDKGSLFSNDLFIKIRDVKKESDFYVHFGRVEHGKIRVGDTITAQIDCAYRRRVQVHHTATHLLQTALRNVVDDRISQAGSLVSFDRLRFDFNYPQALKPDQISQIELQVNNWIGEAHIAKIEIMPLEKAKAKGAIALFGEKYADMVRVIDFSGISIELCGGTHVNSTAEIGVFKIISEGGISSGVRRIEAVAGNAILDYLNPRDIIIRDLTDRLKVKLEEIPERITTLQHDLKNIQKQVNNLKSQLAITKSNNLISTMETVGHFKILVAQIDNIDPTSLQIVAERLQQKIGNGAAVVLGLITEVSKVSLVAAFSLEVNNQGIKAGKFINVIAKICGGGGGGRPNLAMAGGRYADKLPEALEKARADLKACLE